MMKFTIKFKLTTVHVLKGYGIKMYTF